MITDDPISNESGRVQKAGIRALFEAKAEWYFEERERDFAFVTQKGIVLSLFDKDGGNVLDIGCGPGVMVADLLNRGCTVRGIDTSEKMIDLARAKLEKTEGKTRAQFSVGDIENLQFPDADFDAVICMGVLEYLLSDRRAIKEMARVVKPGGTVIITQPSDVSAYELVGKCLGAVLSIRRKILGKTREEPADYTRTCCVPRQLDGRLLGEGIKKVDSAHCNVVLWPGTRLLPVFPPALTRTLEPLSRVRLLGWLGTQYIFKGERL
ncbi:MAG: class I SAM-dependent methyltransferase [Candidatus Eisenbacteria bacterium]